MLNAQNAGYVGVIVVNNHEDLLIMGGSDSKSFRLLVLILVLSSVCVALPSIVVC